MEVDINQIEEAEKGQRMCSHSSPGFALRIGTPGLTMPRKQGGMSMHTGMFPSHTNKHYLTGKNSYTPESIIGFFSLRPSAGST